MKLLITGGTGLIGSRLASAALTRGFQIVVTGQINDEIELGRKRVLEAAGITVTDGKIQDPAFARRVVQGCDTVIHLASAQHEAHMPDSHFHEVNVEGTQCMIRASRDAGVNRFVYGSTIGVYGSATDAELDEESPLKPNNVYGRTKLEAEQVVQACRESIETTICRISETYGPGDMRLLKLFRMVEKGLPVMIGSCLNRHQVIHVDDVAAGLLLASEHPAAAGNTFVFAGEEALTTREFVHEIALALGREPNKLRLPLWPFKWTAEALEKVLHPFGIQAPLYTRRLDFFEKSFLFSTSRARAAIGFAPRIRFRDGVKDTAAWYRASGYLKSSGINPPLPQHPQSSSRE